MGGGSRGLICGCTIRFCIELYKKCMRLQQVFISTYHFSRCPLILLYSRKRGKNMNECCDWSIGCSGRPLQICYVLGMKLRVSLKTAFLGVHCSSPCFWQLVELLFLGLRICQLPCQSRGYLLRRCLTLL